MSTEIGTIKATVHSDNTTLTETIREKASLHINTFWNGQEYGKCVQLTLNYSNKGYIHLTKDDTKKLIKKLIKTL